MPGSLYEAIINWQQSTQSTIIIDGSFQYFKWNGQSLENASRLDKTKTFRLVCPTKAIATHGFRFSYLLLPEKLYDPFDYILDNLSGSSSAHDILSAEKCMNILSKKKRNTELVEYTKKRYQELFMKKIISNAITPDCGYFIFAKLNKKYEKMFQYMDGRYFEQKKYENYVRINLLSSSIQKLLISI